MLQYELKVYDDGECAVRKTTQKILYPTNAIFSSHSDLSEYLQTVISIRWPILEVLDLVDSANENDWIEFK